MEAVKQIIRIPKSHEIKIKVPPELPENETVEVILITKKQVSFKDKIGKLKKAAKDKLFLEDLKEISEDFKAVDFEGLEDAV